MGKPIITTITTITSYTDICKKIYTTIQTVWGQKCLNVFKKRSLMFTFM